MIKIMSHVELSVPLLSVLITIFCHFIIPSASEKILFLAAVSTKSHINVFQPLFKAMADRNHEVTVVTPGYLSKPYKNIREIVPITYEDIFQSKGKAGFSDPFKRRSQGKIGNFISTVNFDFAVRACEKVCESQEMQELFNERFDLIILNGFINNCFHGQIYKMGTPFIMITSMPTPNYVAYAAGHYLPPSFVPFMLSDFTHEMNFAERIMNFFYNQYFNLMEFAILTPFEEIYKKRLGADMPDLTTAEKNVSMIFSNSHFALTYPRPLLPDIVEIGGMHCGPANPLPKDLDDYLTGAEHGFIYFSMGSVVNTDFMPEDIRIKFLNVFSRLKQRVIWKWNSGHMDGLPPNVRVEKWFPQQDILGHKNIRVFITHGGLLSTQEAAYHGVPLIGIPIIADQDLNMKQAVRKGYALHLELLEFTEQILEGLLKDILEKPQYTAEAKKLSSIFKDQMQTPLERAVYWSEYVIRHKGAVHLRSAARKLGFIQYHSIDVIAFIGFVLILIVSFAIVSCRCCLKKTFGRKQVKRESSKKRQ